MNEERFTNARAEGFAQMNRANAVSTMRTEFVFNVTSVAESNRHWRRFSIGNDQLPRMDFHVCRPDGSAIGKFTESEFRRKVFANEIQPDDFYWCDGMADWQLVGNFRTAPKTVPLEQIPPPLPRMSGAETQWRPVYQVEKKKGPPRGLIAVMLVIAIIALIAVSQTEGPKEQSNTTFSRLARQAEENMELVKQHKVRVGMIDEQVEMAWGKPDHVNRYSTASGTIEKWVYPNGDMLTFDGNGMLKSMSTTRGPR